MMAGLGGTPLKRQRRKNKRSNPVLAFEFEVHGKIEIEIFLDTMPVTGSNVLDLAARGSYNDTYTTYQVRGQGIKFGDEQFARKLDNGKISEKNGTGGPEDNSTFKMLRPGRVIVPTDGQPETNKANKSNLNIAKKGKFRLDVSHDTTSRTEWQDVEEGKKN